MRRWRAKADSRRDPELLPQNLVKIGRRQLAILKRDSESVVLLLVLRVVSCPRLGLMGDRDVEGVGVVRKRLFPNPAAKLQCAVGEGVHTRLEAELSAIIFFSGEDIGIEVRTENTFLNHLGTAQAQHGILNRQRTLVEQIRGITLHGDQRQRLDSAPTQVADGVFVFTDITAQPCGNDSCRQNLNLGEWVKAGE